MLTTNLLPTIPVPPAPQTQIPRLLVIPLAQIRRETSQVREQGAIYTGAEFEALLNSIRLLGIQQPLTVEELPATPGSYRLIAGHRRYEAAVHLGMAQLPCLVLPVPMRTQEQAQSSSTELAQAGRRVISQLAENMVRAEMDVIDKATGLKTAKVLADIGKVQEYLAQLGIEESPTIPPLEAGLANTERLAIYEQYLAELSQILTSPPVAEKIANPQIVYQLKNKPGEYTLADQALASWQTIEQACGVSKGQRTALVRLLQLEPALIRLIRGHLASTGNGNATTSLSSDMLRSYLEALLAVPEPCREALLKTYLAYLAQHQHESERAAIAIGEGNSSSNSNSSASASQLVPKLEAKVIRLVAECLGLDELRREWQSVHGQVNYWRVVELATRLASHTQHFKAEVLASLYLSPYPAGEALASFAEGRLIVSLAKTETGLETEMELDPEPSHLPLDPALANSNPPANSGIAQSGSGGGTGKGKSHTGSGGYGEAGGEASESDFGGGQDYGGFADLDEAEGFELTGLAASELPPELEALLEELNLSEAAVKAITSLGDITLQRELVARVKEFPQIAGKLRRVVALVRDEGWALSEALDEALGWVDGKPVGSLANNPGAISTGTLNPDYDSAQAQAQIISGTQRLLDAASSLEEGLELLQKAAPTGKLADLPEPWAANALQILDQLQFTLSMLTGEVESEP